MIFPNQRGNILLHSLES